MQAGFISHSEIKLIIWNASERIQIKNMKCLQFIDETKEPNKKTSGHTGRLMLQIW